MSDFLVIGGGLIGLLTARELANAGATVTLMDKGATGGESSWAGGGIISPLYPWRYPDAVTRLVSWSQAQYGSLCEALAQRTGIDPQYTTNGLLVFSAEEAEQAERWAAAFAIELQHLDADAVAGLEPALACPVAAFWLPRVAQVRNPRLVKAVRADIAADVSIVEQAEVLELLVKNGRAIGVRTPGGIFLADKTIVCAGAWTAELFAQFGEAPEIQPVRGQMILFNARPDDVRRIVLRQDRYVIPRRDGRVLIGSTLEHVGFDKRISTAVRDELYAQAIGLFPGLKRASIEKHWAGLRPSSPSGIPYIGAYPDIEGLYFNAGHFRNGVVLGPASARLMADIALQRPPIVAPDAYCLRAVRRGAEQSFGA